MTTIPRDLLAAGMVLSDDVLNARGQVLIPSGTVIEGKHLRGLMAWGIKTVAVTPSTAPDDIVDTEEAVLLSPEEVDAFITEFFCLNHDRLTHPFVQEILTLSKDRLAKHGMTPAVQQRFESVPAPEDAVLESTPEISVGELVGMTTSIATLPNIYFELQNVMSRPLSASVDMAKAIRNDPGLTARLLRIVNSAYYSFPSKIETVPRAITIVGTDELTSLVTATSVLKTFGAGLDNLIDMDLFWRHSISCGVIARILGNRRQEQNSERFFVMGLLHDIGKVLMFSHIPKVARAVLTRARLEKQPLSNVESDMIGFNHALVGAALARSWRMAAGQQEAISYHHRPSFAMRYPLEAALTHVADILAHVLCIGQCPNGVVPLVETDAFDKLSLDMSMLEKVMEEADEQVSELVGIFFSE